MRPFLSKISPVLLLIGICWAVEIANLVSGRALAAFGILPRTVEGLAGIPLAPFIHGNPAHLVSNTLPLLFLGSIVLFSDRRHFWTITALIALGGGTATWLLAREAYHIGASGLVFGFFGYILARAYYFQNPKAVLFAGLTVFFYGGLIFGVLPGVPSVSFESHLFGFIAGAAVATLFSRKAKIELVADSN